MRSFKDKDTQALYEGKSIKKWNSFLDQAEKRLHILDMSVCLDDLKNLPSNRLEALKGKRKGQYSIRINKQWRICFKWKESESYDVEIVDYH